MLRAVSTLTSLQAACLVVPLLRLLLIFARRYAAGQRVTTCRTMLAGTVAYISTIGAVGIVALAFTLGLVLRQSPLVADLIASSGLDALPPLVILFIVLLGMIATAVLYGPPSSRPLQ